ncbi:MAG: histidinol phosphate phosphatase [Planctomycetes bacterium]|nr:histidinol phosphate phosphatase [Planctomycetota bacterium]
MSTLTSADLLATALGAADAAGRATLARFRTALTPETKSDGSIVTLADRESERILRDYILARHPDHSILGEEDGETTGAADCRWIVDPIDGTESFARGVPLYAVLVAVERAGEIVAGVAHFPALGETVAAAKGSGCTWTTARGSQAARVSALGNLARAMLVTTSETIARRSLPGWPTLAGSVARVRGWSDAYGLACVATGRADVLVEPDMKPWDNAPFLVILEEAGGRFTDVSGRRTVHGGSAVATNGALHDEVLAALRRG